MTETSRTETIGRPIRALFLGSVLCAFVVVGVWLLALLGVAIGTDIVKTVGKAFDRKEDPRAFLPNYSDQDLALQIYRDQNAATREYRPLIEYKSKPLQTRTINIDAQGSRLHKAGKDNNVSGAVPFGFFGGSAMFGTGESDDNTIPAQFDLITTDYAVTNYAELGWTGRQNLVHLINLTAEGQAPTFIVFYDGFNDVRTLCNRAVTESLSGTSLESRFRALMARGRRQTGIYNTLIAPIVDLTTASMSETRFDYICDKDPLAARRVAGAFVQTWLMADAIAKANGGQFFGFLQPNIFTGKPKSDYLPPGIDNDGANSDLLRKEFDAVYPLIREELAKTDLAWADLSDAFDVDEPLFVDNSHVTVKGNTIIAARMRERIEDQR